MKRPNHTKFQKDLTKTTRLRTEVKRAERALLRAKQQRAAPCHCRKRAQADPIEEFENLEPIFEELITALRGGPFIPPGASDHPEEQP